MARRISLSQFKSQVRRAQQKQKQAINKYNREVKKHNQEVKQAVSKINKDINRYNAAARSHNNRVRNNRNRLKRELEKLANQATTTRYIKYRETVNSLQSSFQHLEDHVESSSLGNQYDEILDYSEREAANNIGVMNALFDDDDQSSEIEDDEPKQWLLDFLGSISTDLLKRWQGALFSLNPTNPDAARHFCTSAREVITQILEIKAPDRDVFLTLPDSDKTDRGNATRRSKIRYFLHNKGLSNNHLEEFIERDVDAVVQLFGVFNSGTHGEAGTYGHGQLLAIRKRVEDGIEFLAKIIS